MIYQAFDGQKKLNITSPRFSVIRMAIFYLEILAKCATMSTLDGLSI